MKSPKRLPLIAFEVHVNGQHLCTAGLDEPGLISAILRFSRWPIMTKAGPSAELHESAGISVGGLIDRNDEHVNWSDKELKTGDEVAIRLVKKGEVSSPASRNRDTIARIRARQKRQVKRMVKFFGWELHVPKRKSKKSGQKPRT